MAGKMLKMQNLFYICFLLLFPRKLECFGAEMTNITCEELNCQPNDICVCQGSNVTIPWVIPHQGDFWTADWSFENSINVTTIASSDSIDDVNITDSFNAIYNGNGSITLTSVTPDNTGIYRAAVAYNFKTHASITGTVTISVYDAPSGLNFSKEMGSDNDIIYQCKTTQYGSPAASLNIYVDGSKINSDTDSVTKYSEVECCVSGPAVRCMDEGKAGCSAVQKCIEVQTKPEDCECPFREWKCKKGSAECIICWILFILIILLGALLALFPFGLIIGICITGGPKALQRCFRCEATGFSECCQCCDNFVRCKCCGSCCDIVGVPFWYYILWWTVIGTPVAFGIFIIMKCRKEEVRYVVVEHDDNGLLGFNHGSVIVTKVTHGGPADNKLKVGEHVRKVGKESTEGKTLEEIHRMLNNKTSLTLAVSKVGSDDTRSVLIRYNQGEQLGFVADICIMVSNVQAGGPADGKLKVGERVLSINGKSTASKSNKEIKKWLKPTSNSIKLSIKTASGKEKDVELHYDNKASLGIEIDKNESQHIVVSTVKKKSTAAKSIQKGDHILKVNGESTQNMSITKVRGKMKSSVGFKVTKDVTLLELDPDKNTIGLGMCPANTVTSVTPGGSAATAGIKQGQKILSINGENTDRMSREEIIEVLHSSKKSVTLKLGEGSSPDVKHTATSKSHPPNTRSSNEKSADQLPHPEVSHAGGAYGGGMGTSIAIEIDTVSYSKRKKKKKKQKRKDDDPVSEDLSRRKSPPTGHDVPGHHFHEKLPDIQQI